MLLKPNVGRALSAIGALVVVLALFMVWYHVLRPNGLPDSNKSGWDTFTNLRYVILGAAAIVVISALVPQTRPVLVVRTILGLVVALLVLRRIIDPPTLAQTTLKSQVGLYFGVLGGLAIAVGGLVDSGREIVEVYPNLFRPVAGELGRGTRSLDRGDDPAEPRT